MSTKIERPLGLVCDTDESCIKQRRTPDENEERGLWSRQACMNCKRGIERERALAATIPVERCQYCGDGEMNTDTPAFKRWQACPPCWLRHVRPRIAKNPRLKPVPAAHILFGRRLA